jgi:hypothetical protein
VNASGWPKFVCFRQNTIANRDGTVLVDFAASLGQRDMRGM